MIKVSVIVPVYNVEDYIEKCLNSLVNQTLEDIEIIIVNDGSKDNSENIIKSFLSRYPQKIKYLKKENGGLSDARNYGIPYATGEYIAFLDSDDYVELDTYENMYNLAKKENSDMVECNFIWEYPNKARIDIGTTYNNKHEMIEKVSEPIRSREEYRNNISLEESLDLQPLSDEIKKNDDFLNALKDFRKNLQ